MDLSFSVRKKNLPTFKKKQTNLTSAGRMHFGCENFCTSSWRRKFPGGEDCKNGGVESCQIEA
jgi:hypothetical protein